MKVSELIPDATFWTKHVAARDKDDKSVDVYSPTACKWCLLGAIVRCYGHQIGFRLPFYQVLQKRTRLMSISTWQDDENTTYEDVIALVREVECMEVEVIHG